MENPSAKEFLILNDGRQLGYQSLGDPNGHPFYFFHGTPGSRLVLSDDDAIAKLPGIKLILPERPGYGISTPKPNRTICDWADDIDELADALSHPEFSVGGSSGGGPYALAVGAKLHSRVARVVLLNSACPISYKGATKGMAFGNRVGVLVTRYAPWLLSRLIKLSAKQCQRNPLAFAKSLAHQLPEKDKQLLADESYCQAIARDVAEAYRNGSDGHLSDARLAYHKDGWGFEFEELKAPIHLWHGELDPLVPIHGAKQMANQLPNCKTSYIPDGGHLLVDYPIVIDGLTELFSQNTN